MSNALSNSNSKLARLNPAKITGYSPFKTLIIREFWEHKRAAFYTPMFITLFFIILIIIALLSGDGPHFGKIHINEDDLNNIPEGAINIALLSSSVLIWIGVSLAMIFTALGTLYDERKDGSILFWKSMPISDSQTIFSKIITVLFVIPLVSIPFIWISQIFILLAMSSVAAGTGIHIWQNIWAPADFIQITIFFLSFILTNALWMAPIFAWFMLVSVTAKRAPFLTAIIIPAITVAAEGLLFHTHHFGSWIGNHIGHGVEEDSKTAHILKEINNEEAFNILSIAKELFLNILTAECAIGLLIATVMTYTVIQIRKRNSI
jgi:ABC-2 type transport system permease protein